MSKSLPLHFVLVVGIIICGLTFVTPSNIQEAGAMITVPGGDCGYTKFGSSDLAMLISKVGAPLHIDILRLSPLPKMLGVRRKLGTLRQ